MSTKKWYVVHTYSGYEEKVKATVEENVQRQGLGEKVGQILIPQEKVVKLKAGKKVESNKKFYPDISLLNLQWMIRFGIS